MKQKKRWEVVPLIGTNIRTCEVNHANNKAQAG